MKIKKDERGLIMKIRCIFAVCIVLAAAGVSSANSEETEYYAVLMEGKKVGHSVLNRVTAEGKVTITRKTNIQVNQADVSTKVVTTETTIETTDGKPLGFKVTQESGNTTASISGTVDELWIVNVTAISMGKERKRSFGWPSGAVMDEGLRLLELEKGFKEGLEYNVKIFDPASVQALEAKIHIGPKQNVDLLGRIVALTEVKTTFKVPRGGEIIRTRYVDDNGDVKKRIVPIAGTQPLEMIACPKEVALGEKDAVEMADKRKTE